MDNTVYVKCFFCDYKSVINKMTPIVKKVGDWDSTITGGHTCGSRDCRNKVVEPFYVERTYDTSRFVG